jgi:hypothetical protein
MASKEKTAEAFPHWAKSLNPLTLVVYSNGSLSEKGMAGYGFIIHQDNSPIFKGAGHLGPAEVFNAEARGALEGLKAALNLPTSATQNAVICLDNLAAASCLRGTPPTPLKISFLSSRLWRHRIGPYPYIGCQDTPTFLATNRPIC